MNKGMDSILSCVGWRDKKQKQPTYVLMYN